MSILKMKSIGVSVFALIAVCCASGLVNGQGGEQRRPELPAGCEHLDAPAEERVAFKVFAEGVQIYSWSGAAWVPVGPLADLFADRGNSGKVGIHYGGPRWESNSGSIVRGTNPIPCVVDPGSIPWLLLSVAETEGPGIFSQVRHIQRVNTSGGKSPSSPGGTIGEEVRVPYTTEYVFYTAGN